MQAQKPKPSEEAEKIIKDRGAALSFYLIFSAVAIIIVFAISNLWFYVLITRALRILYYPTLLLPFAILVFIVGTWSWKKWAYYGLIASYIISAIISLLTGLIFIAIFFLIELGLLITFGNSKLKLFN